MHHALGRPRWPALLLLVTATLLLHVALLGGSDWRATHDTPARPHAAPVQVRSVTLPQAEVVVAEKPAGPPQQRVMPMKAHVPPVAAPSPAPIAVAQAPPVLETPGSDEPTTPAPDVALLAEVAAKQSPLAGDTDVPVYRTEPPPPMTLRYDLRRGMFSGQGELHWRPSGERYEARLEARIGGIDILTQTSQGQIDAAGIAPNRFTDKRRRDTRAANFQRDKGLITFSGPRTEYPLLPGSQDRLSWMIQLGAITNAEPQHATPGGKVSMFVVGSRGDGELWVFRFVAQEIVDTPAGPVHAVKFTREPRRAYDTLAEIWLDPLRFHLPVRAKLTVAPDGASLDLLLRELQ